MIARTDRTLCLRTEWLVGAAIAVIVAVAVIADQFGWPWAAGLIVVAVGGPLLTVLLIGFLRGRELMARAAQRVSYTCPKCGRSGRPAYKCPACGTAHDDLIPGVFGVFSAVCGNGSCGTPLATCGISGRERLQKVCAKPACGGEIPHGAAGSVPEYRIALVGAASSGKSNLLVSAVWQLREHFAPTNGYEVTFANPDEEKKFERMVDQLKTGIAMQKTFDRLPALTVSVKSADEGECLLHLFDAAGEHFADEQTLREHPIEQADAIMLLVDPFAEETVARGALGDLDMLSVGQANAAAEQVQNIANRLVNVLEQKLANPDRRFHIPIAIVVTKIDVAGLDEQFGVGFTNLRGSYPSFGAAVTRAEGERYRVRELLLALGLGNLVQTAETKFDQVGYFAASPLGRSLAEKPGEPFEPRGVLPPLVWVCSAVNALGDTDPVDVFLTNTHLYIERCLRGLEGEEVRRRGWGILLGAAVVAVLVALFLPGPLQVVYAVVVVPLVLLYFAMVYLLIYRRTSEE